MLSLLKECLWKGSFWGEGPNLLHTSSIGRVPQTVSLSVCLYARAWAVWSLGKEAGGCLGTRLMRRTMGTCERITLRYAHLPHARAPTPLAPRKRQDEASGWSSRGGGTRCPPCGTDFWWRARNRGEKVCKCACFSSEMCSFSWRSPLSALAMMPWKVKIRIRIDFHPNLKIILLK